LHRDHWRGCPGVGASLVSRSGPPVDEVSVINAADETIADR
jgi:hypothetical protein